MIIIKSLFEHLATPNQVEDEVEKWQTNYAFLWEL
jgi:hypothetical protein